MAIVFLPRPAEKAIKKRIHVARPWSTKALEEFVSFLRAWL
jgi:hypothetical protein